MKIWQKTDQGVIRKENQDACGVQRTVAQIRKELNL